MPLLHANRIQPLVAVMPSRSLRRSASASVSALVSVPALALAANDVQGHCLGPTPRNAASDPLHLSPFQFALVWVVYVTVNTLNATLTLGVAGIYYGAYTVRGGYMIDSVGLLSLQYIPIVIISYAFLALVFWTLSLQAIVGSIRMRRLVFKRTIQVPNRSTPTDFTLRRINQLFTKHVAFEVRFLAREVLEVVTQSYQVYKCSTLTSMAWINNFYVSTLVINCWVSPVIHLRLHHHRSLQRFCYLCSDIMLDFAATFVVPVWIIATIVVGQFENNLASTSGDMEYAFDVPMDDVSFSNMVKAVQQVFVVTWLDVFTKLLPFVSMASCFGKIQQFVEVCPSAKTIPSQQSARLLGGHSQPSARQVQPTSVTHKSNALPQSSSCWRRLVGSLFSVHMVHALFALWGACIVAIQVQTYAVASHSAMFNSEGCKTSAKPWFVDKLSCTVLEINCYRRGFTGDAHEIASVLAKVDAGGIGSLIISHCPRLHMPSEIHTLRNLMWLEIYNVTFVEWDEASALVNSKLPALQYVNLVRVNMTELPVGLQSPHFPNRLRDITITLSNITTLPHDLHTKWTRMVNLVLEHTLMETIPTTVAHMNPSRLSVFGNRITSIPADFFSPDADFWILSIAKNPVAAWPESIGKLDRVYLILMDYTEIVDLPHWLVGEGVKRARENQGGITVSAGGSPFCQERMSHADKIAPDSFPGLNIVCRQKVDAEIEAYVMSYYQPMRLP